ncbi:hypothetical protein BB560_003274, partial [Smittium megazygosporum]
EKENKFILFELSIHNSFQTIVAMSDLSQLEQRLSVLEKVVGESQATGSLPAQISEIKKALESSLLFKQNTEIFQIYSELDSLIDSNSIFGSVAQKQQEILSLEQDFQQAFKLASNSKLLDLSKTLDSDSFHRVAELNGQVTDFASKAAEHDSKLSELEQSILCLVSQYHNEVSAMNQILITLDSHLNSIKNKMSKDL